MSVRIDWFGDQFLRHCHNAMQSTMLAGGEAYRDEIRHEIATSSPPASLPGQPPHRLTGELFNSMFAAAAPGGSGVGSVVVVRIGSTSDHALPLELGTARMAPRPYFLPALFGSHSVIVSAMAAGVP